MEETIISNLDELEEGGDKKPFLTFLKGPNMGQPHAIDKAEMTLGRSTDCDLVIDDSSISRKHFKLSKDENGVLLSDLGSTNGTYVNGEKVGRAYLSQGDKIRISQNSLLEFNYLDEARSLTEKKLYEMGVRDPGTGIYNKRFFLDRIKEEFSHARRKKRDLSLVMIDIDHFKKLNDTHGHLAGDLVLEKVCQEILPVIRTDDIFARYGGEEFVILMRDAQKVHAMDLAERLRKLVESLKIAYEKKIVQITVSCGVSSRTDEIADHLALIALADKYLYKSKENGRNQVSGPT